MMDHGYETVLNTFHITLTSRTPLYILSLHGATRANMDYISERGRRTSTLVLLGSSLLHHLL